MPHRKFYKKQADYYLVACFIIWQCCQYFCAWVFKRHLNDSYKLVIFMSVSGNTSILQECFSKLLLQCVVGHRQAWGSAEKKLEIKVHLYFPDVLGAWLRKSKNEARIVGLGYTCRLFGSSALCAMVGLNTQIGGRSLTAFSTFELMWKGPQDKLFVKASRSIKRSNCGTSSTKLCLIPPAILEFLLIFLYYPGLSDCS